jgi:phage portal protein BeeE
LATRVASSIADWLSDFTGVRIDLRPDQDQVAALAQERDSQWRRVSEATFLTDAEKRALLGLPSLEVGDGR